MRLISLLALALMMSAAPLSAHARPVSYPEGWTVMQLNDADRNSLHAHYSPTAKYSIGYKAEYWREKEWQFHGAQLNYLVKRWNMPQAQANLYAKTGAGIALGDDKNTGKDTQEPAGFVELAADAEDRRFFGSYAFRATYAGDIDQFATHTTRVGVAPYIGNYGDIHTWLMLETEYDPGAQDRVTFTPLVRFFKDVYLLEVGVNDKGDGLLNAIIRF